MTKATFRAMGTSVDVWSDPVGVEATRHLFSLYEDRFSRFLAGSELSRINGISDSGSDVEMDVSLDMAKVLTVADDLRIRTQGAFEIGVGNAVRSWGYDRTFDEVADLTELPLTTSHPDWSISGNTLRVAAGTRLDLGGIAKGWSCDQVVEHGLADAVSAGGDMRSMDPELEVEIVDENDEVVAEVPLGIGALATSSTRKRQWKVAGEHAHHIIDPRTMEPMRSPVYAATVIADTASEAEAGAKTALLHGEDSLTWAASQPWIRQTIVRWHDGNVYSTKYRRAS